MRGVFESLTSPLRQLAWKIEEKLVWPAADAVDDVRYLSPDEPSPAASARASWWQRYWPDLVVAVLLLVVAFLARRHGLPTDGLWHDDTNPAAGVKDASSISQLLAVSLEHPGFTTALIGWSDLTGGGDASLIYPALIAGTLSGPLLYLALRGCGYERSISALLGAALAAAQTDIVYSGRIRTYAIDVLIVLGLAMIVPRLVRRRWRWKTAIAWVVAAFAVSTFSGFALIALGVAGAIIVFHPASDLRVRAAAIGTQALTCAALLVVEGHTYNQAIVRDHYRTETDAFLTFHANPLRFANEVLVHLGRIAQTFPGGRGWFATFPSGHGSFATLSILAALAALVAIAWTGLQAIRARYLLLLFLVAFVGGVLGYLPFGPEEVLAINDGGRVSLWLIPVLAVGLAAFLQGVRILVGRRRTLRIGFDAVIYLAAAATLVSAAAAKQPLYPFPGPKSATDFIESHLGQHDSVLIGYHADWSFAFESHFASTVKPTPDSTYGFHPVFGDPRIHYLDVGLHAERFGTELVGPRYVAPAVKRADRVFVYYAMPRVEVPETGARVRLRATLRTLGFARQRTARFQDATVQVWRSRKAAAAASINLSPSDLPRGWRMETPANKAPSAGILACLHVPAAKVSRSVASAVGPPSTSGLHAFSEVTRWPTAVAAQRAYAALSGGDAAGCIRSTLRSALHAIGYHAAIAVRKVPPPPAGGNPAVAYAVSVGPANGAKPLARGTVVLFAGGKLGVLTAGYSAGGGTPFPANLLSRIVTRVADRANAAPKILK